MSNDQRQGIEAVAMDMWDPYVASVREHLPLSESKIVFDKFHIAQHLAKAVDQVRRRENKLLKQAGDERLVGSKYLWLRHPGSFSNKQ
jgi:transposase